MFGKSIYRRNKASGLSHTHLNTLNSDHYVYGRALDKLQSYTPPIYPGWGEGIWLFMFAGPNKSDCNFIPDAISNNERELLCVFIMYKHVII